MVDKAVEGGRTQDLNDILNTLDGIDTKSNPIITVLTTNHIENINKAFLRAGRIDTLVFMMPLDASMAMQFLNKHVSHMMAPDQNLLQVAEQLSGIVPAFASEVINKAKMYAMYRTGNPDVSGKITSDDLIKATLSLKEHIALTSEVVEKSHLEKLGENAENLFRGILDGKFAVKHPDDDYKLVLESESK